VSFGWRSKQADAAVVVLTGSIFVSLFVWNKT